MAGSGKNGAKMVKMVKFWRESGQNLPRKVLTFDPIAPI
jgi:hypothetical protein